MSASEWNLVAAGPSRQHLRHSHFLDGPVVAVNRAVDIVERGLRVDFLAIADGPGGCWEQMNLERFWSPGMTLWVTTRLLHKRVNVTNDQGVMEERIVPSNMPVCALWDTKLSASIGFRFMPDLQVPDVDHPNDPAKTRSGFTTLQALAGITRYRPKKIRILSMDLKGPWMVGLTEAECDAKDKTQKGLSRWRHERKAMDDAIALAKKMGIAVEEMIPSGIETV